MESSIFLPLKLGLIGFVLGLFLHSLQSGIFSYTTVIKDVMFIRVSSKLGLFCIICYNWLIGSLVKWYASFRGHKLVESRQA